MDYDSIFKCFPQKLIFKINEIMQTDKELNSSLEEIRIRINLPVILKGSYEEKVIDYIINREEISLILQKICENSLYSYQNQIVNGYITIKRRT